MPSELFTNNASTTVAAAKTAVAAGTTESWTVAASTGFPAASSAVSPATQFQVVDPAAQSEVIRVVNVSGTTWTVVRGAEGTTPVAHAAGFTVAHVVTAALLRQMFSNNAFALRRWGAALSKVASSPVNVMHIGDSNTEGMAATTADARWVAQVRDQLRALIPTPGVAGGPNYIPSRLGATSFTVPVVVAGSPAASGYGLGGRSYDLATTAQSLTFTVTGTSFHMLYARGGSGSGTFSYSIDGATAVNVNTATGAPAQTDDTGFTAVSFATRGTHTVKITYVSAATVTFEGLVVFDGDETAGIRMYESGYYGRATSDIVQYIGFGSFAFADRITYIQPALVTIQLGTNDVSTTAGNVTAAAYKANLQTIINTINAACTLPPSIVLIAAFRPNVTEVEPWGNYVQALYDLAGSNANCCVVDYNPKMPAVAGDVQGLYSDTVHWNNNGHTAAGAILANFLTMSERVTSTLRRVTSRLTAAFATASGTYVPTGLGVYLQPNTAYTIRAQGQYRTPATATGIALRLNFGGTTTAIRYFINIWGASGSASTPNVAVLAANQGANVRTTAVAATTDYLWEIEGTIRVGASGGILAVEMAIGGTTGTVTVQPESALYADPA